MGHSDGWIKKHYLDEGYVVCGDCKFFKPDEKKNDGSGICSKKGEIKGFNSVSICEKFRPTRDIDNMKFRKIVKEANGMGMSYDELMAKFLEIQKKLGKKS